MAKFVSYQEAAALVKDGMTIMVGGFCANGGPNEIMHAIAESGVKDLTVIANDGGKPGQFEHQIAELIHNGQIKKMICTHIGLNPEIAQKWFAGEMEVQLVPQGSFVEKIRCGGFGLGGILTPTGFGTEMAEGKQVINVNGKDYLLEEPLKADIAFVYGTIVDKYGNIAYEGTTRNFNCMMAFAGKTCVVEAERCVDILDPNRVEVPGPVVDYVCGGAK
jgi:acetate CoA/acetoacetate CoA-transferase alpha subunit